MSMTLLARASRLLRQPSPLIFAAAAMAILVVAGFLLSLFAPSNPLPHLADAASPLLSGTVPIQPKPFDKFLFFGIMPFVAIVLMGVTFAAERTKAKPVDVAPLFWSLVGMCLVVSVWRGALSGLIELTEAGQWIWTVLCFGAAGFLLWKLKGTEPLSERRINRAILIAAMATSALILAGMRIWLPENIEYSATFTSHYEAVTLAPIRIVGGGTCLVDVIAQYGCNGEFVAPILRLVGSSVLAVTTIYALLQIVAVWALLAFAKRTIRFPAIFLGSVLCIFIEVILNLTPTANDVVLQYHPVRFLFPALSLLLIKWLQEHMTMRGAAVAGLFSGAALCWNLEAGLAVLLSLAIFIFVGSLSEPFWHDRKTAIGACVRLSAYTIAATAFACAFIFYLHIKSGHDIDLSNYVIFQTTFYQTGFGMLPIPPFPDYWTLHAAIVLCILVIAAMAAGSGAESDKTLERIAYLAILAIGLSLYYSGRSHVRVLKLVAWPDAVLFFYLADRAIQGAKFATSHE